MKILCYLGIGAVISMALSAVSVSAAPPSLDSYNIVWDSPSDDSKGSMPLGNGDIGVNVWVEKSSGDLVFYVSKTDAWGDDIYGSYGLPKVGRVRVHLDPSPFSSSGPFRQTLRIQDGTIAIEAGAPENQVRLRLWVDANHPVIHLNGSSAQPERMQVRIDSYRQKPAHGLNADTILPAQKDAVSWCYRNTNKTKPDLTNRTFGAIIQGGGMISAGNTTLQSLAPQKQFDVRLYPLTAQTETPEAWHTLAEKQAQADRRNSMDTAFKQHQKWWREFWDRSWIVAGGNADADTVTRGYFLQRFVSACAGRGAYPIKFNGSIFTTDYTEKSKDRDTGADKLEEMDADYRRWGGQYWFQNTRPMYWPMMESGDFDMMQPLFRMYAAKIPASKQMIRDYYGHDGAYFSETAPFWAELPHITPEDKPLWTNRYFTPILELSAMMLDYYDYTDDRAFVQQILLPVADAGVAFFDQHFPRDASGKLYLKDDNAIETYWKVNNPAPDIAGLHYVLQRLLQLPQDLTTAEQRARWQKLLAILPDLPQGDKDGKKVLLPYLTADDPGRKNGENPELYAVYPFRLYGVGKPDLELARNTFAVRQARGSTCWLQDPVHAAYLGDAALARKDVLENFSDSSRDTQERFPVFWGPFHDYTPDEDNGGNGLHTLQIMLLQSEGDKMLLIPAWPADWDATFKLHAPHHTIVEGTVHAGRVTSLAVTPRSRRKDVFLVQPDGKLKGF